MTSAEYKHQHYLANREKYKARAKAWRKANPQAVKKASKKYTRSQKAVQKKKEWYALNRGEINTRRKEKRKSYTRQIFADRLRTLVRNSLRSQGGRKAIKTVEAIGCSIDFLKVHLESKFQAGMSWADRQSFHIDHIKPCALFDLTDPEQQKACFHYTNLQPLRPVDNIRKGARYG